MNGSEPLSTLDEGQLPPGIVGGHLGTKLGDPGAELLLGQQDLGHVGRHVGGGRRHRSIEASGARLLGMGAG